MKLLRIVVLAIAGLVLCTRGSEAQTTTRTLRWSQPNATLAEVQAYTYTTQVDAGTPQIVTPTCATGTPVTCTAPIAFVSGPHTITLTVMNAFGNATASTSGAPPSGPISVSVTIQVSVP